MITINMNIRLKTNIRKKSIKKDSIVITKSYEDENGFIEVQDKEGNTALFNINELNCFGITTYNNKILEITKEEKNFRGEKVIYGYEYITKNIRRGEISRRYIGENFYYCELRDREIDYYEFYEYNYKEIEEKDIIKILEDDIIYGEEPTLFSSTLLGTNAKGIDKEPNRKRGKYKLNNNKIYEIILGGESFAIKYEDKVLIEKNIDWDRYKKALIKSEIVRQLRFGNKALEKFSEIEEIMYNKLKEEERFKLSWEI